MAKATKVSVAYENEVHTVNVQPTASDNGAPGFAIGVQFGMTQPEGDKKPSRRFRVFRNDVDLGKPAATAKAAVEMAIGTMGEFANANLYNVEDAVKQIKDLLAPDAEEKEQAWDKLANADELRAEQTAANDAATLFFAGERDMREGLYDLSRHVASVAAQLTPKQFKAWAEDGPEALKKALTGQNAKSEFTFVGRLPKDYFDAQPETTNSPKAYQRNFNLAKNEIAEAVAKAAWKGQKGHYPKAGKIQKVFSEVLDEARGNVDEDTVTSVQILARAMYDHISLYSEGFTVVTFADSEEGPVPAKAPDAGYIVPTQFGTGERAHELILATCKAIKALSPEKVAEDAEADREREVTQAVQPRKFAEYTPREAAMHLANILQSHAEYGEVLDHLNAMADQAEKDGWSQAIRDAHDAVSAEEAEAEKAEAEADAEDEA